MSYSMRRQKPGKVQHSPKTNEEEYATITTEAEKMALSENSAEANVVNSKIDQGSVHSQTSSQNSSQQVKVPSAAADSSPGLAELARMQAQVAALLAERASMTPRRKVATPRPATPRTPKAKTPLSDAPPLPQVVAPTVPEPVTLEALERMVIRLVQPLISRLGALEDHVEEKAKEAVTSAAKVADQQRRRSVGAPATSSSVTTVQEVEGTEEFDDISHLSIGRSMYENGEGGHHTPEDMAGPTSYLRRTFLLNKNSSSSKRTHRVRQEDMINDMYSSEVNSYGLLIMDVNRVLYTVDPGKQKDHSRRTRGHSAFEARQFISSKATAIVPPYERSNNIFPTHPAAFAVAMTEQSRLLSASGKPSDPGDKRALLDEFVDKCDQVISSFHDAAHPSSNNLWITLWANFVVFYYNRWMRAMVNQNFDLLLENFDSEWSTIYVTRMAQNMSGASLLQDTRLLQFSCPRCGTAGYFEQFCTSAACVTLLSKHDSGGDGGAYAAAVTKWKADFNSAKAAKPALTQADFKKNGHPYPIRTKSVSVGVSEKAYFQQQHLIVPRSLPARS